MEDPLNPIENQDPSNSNDNPFEDPLLGALERGIENPPGFVDPLVGPDEPPIDDLAKQLDAVEASIENSPPILPEPGVVEDDAEPSVEGEEPITPEVPGSTEDVESPEPKMVQWGGFQSSPPHPQEGSSHTPPPNPPLPKVPRRGGTGIRRRRGLPFKGRIPRQAGRLMVRKNRNIRFCPESNETIDTQECEKCEKYRHWPEGTDEEPRECWYDWQARQSPNEVSEDDE